MQTTAKEEKQPDDRSNTVSQLVSHKDNRFWNLEYIKKINQDALQPQKLLPAVFPYSQCAVDGVKYSKHLQPLIPFERGAPKSSFSLKVMKPLPLPCF